MLLRTAPFQDWAATRAQQDLGNAAERQGDYLTAADCFERLNIILLQSGFFFTDSKDYLAVPATVHSARGRGLLKAGKIPKALAELRQAESIMPGHTDFVIEVVPKLERAGRKQDADALFQRTVALYETICREFPNSTLYHNNLAWMAASLDRELDMALAHAQRAVRLEPDKWGYLDTLAEVHFRKGNRPEAVRLMKRCLELEPKSEYLLKQLARFQAASH